MYNLHGNWIAGVALDRISHFDLDRCYNEPFVLFDWLRAKFIYHRPVSSSKRTSSRQFFNMPNICCHCRMERKVGQIKRRTKMDLTFLCENTLCSSLEVQDVFVLYTLFQQTMFYGWNNYENGSINFSNTIIKVENKLVQISNRNNQKERWNFYSNQILTFYSTF